MAAVNETPSIPPLQADQIPQAIFHCQDILGNITGNSYCINGCLSALTLTMDDQCAVGGNGTCPPGNGTITITSTSTTTTTMTTTVSGSGGSVSCVRQCQTWCFGKNSNFIDPTQAPLAMPTLFWAGINSDTTVILSTSVWLLVKWTRQFVQYMLIADLFMLVFLKKRIFKENSKAGHHYARLYLGITPLSHLGEHR